MKALIFLILTSRYPAFLQTGNFNFITCLDLLLPAKGKKTRSSFYFPSAKPLNENKSQSKFGLEVISQWEPLHLGTDRYIINPIQVIYFKLKESWPLFSIAKGKKQALFFNESKSQSKFGLEVISKRLPTLL